MITACCLYCGCGVGGLEPNPAASPASPGGATSSSDPTSAPGSGSSTRSSVGSAESGDEMLREEIVDQTDIRATPQTVMRIESGVQREFQNGPSDEDRKKFEAFSRRNKKPRTADDLKLPGASGDILFDDTGTMKVPDRN